MKKIMYLLIMLFLMASCKTVKYVEVPVETIKTEYIHNTDSIYVKDSTFHEIKTQGDTVRDTKIIMKVLKEFRIDTLMRIDTIPVIQKLEIPVETNVLKWYQKVFMYAGISFFLIILILIIIAIINIFK